MNDLHVFQAWADAFRSSPDLTGVVHIYEELKRKGIEFPMADLDALSPIHTPQRVSYPWKKTTVLYKDHGIILLFLLVTSYSAENLLNAGGLFNSKREWKRIGQGRAVKYQNLFSRVRCQPRGESV